MAIEKSYEFDGVNFLSAKAVGAPGKRTFFLIIGQKDKWVRIWLEKAILESLADAIGQFLQTLAKENIKIDRRTTAGLSEVIPTKLPAAELEISEMTLGYDHDKAALDIIVHGMGPQREIQSEVQCFITLIQLKKLGDEAEAVCAAGRPLCPVCGGPIDPSGHTCPGTN